MCYKTCTALNGKSHSREYLMERWDKLQCVDERVEAAISKGDFRGAWTVLVKAYLPKVVGFCTLHLRDQKVAEEVAQEVCIVAYQAMPRYKPTASVRVWLFAIARK